jgi:predicted porin
MSSKILLVLALALPAAARADELPLQVHPSGFLNGEVEWARAIGGTTPYSPRMRVSDGNSRFGIFGSYALSPQLEVQVQLEGLLNNFAAGGVNDQGQTFSLMSRNTFIAVSDKRFGTLLAGYYDNAYRSLVGTGGPFGGNWGLTDLGLDLWNNTSAAMSGGFSSLFGRGESRLANSVHYRSPDIFGMRVTVSYALDEALAQGGRRDHFSAAALYTFEGPLKGLSAGVGFDHQANTGIDFDRLYRGQGMQLGAENDVGTTFYKAIVSYLAPTGTYVGFGYERSVYGIAGFYQPGQGQVYTPISYGDMSQGGAMLSAAQAIGSLTVMGSVGKLGKLGNAAVGVGDDYQSTQYSLGAKYAFNPSFMAYVYFTRIDNHAQQNVNLGVPVYSSDLGTSAAFLAPGDKPTAGGTGLIARF